MLNEGRKEKTAANYLNFKGVTARLCAREKFLLFIQISKQKNLDETPGAKTFEISISAFSSRKYSFIFPDCDPSGWRSPCFPYATPTDGPEMDVILVIPRKKPGHVSANKHLFLT